MSASPLEELAASLVTAVDDWTRAGIEAAVDEHAPALSPTAKRRLRTELERRAPNRVDLAKITRAGQRRAGLLAAAEEELELIVAELRGARETANVTLVAELSGVPRATIYRRLGRQETT